MDQNGQTKTLKDYYPEIHRKRTSVAAFKRTLEITLLKLARRREPQGKWADQQLRDELAGADAGLNLGDAAKQIHAVTVAADAYIAKRAALLAEVERKLQPELETLNTANQTLKDAVAAISVGLNAFKPKLLLGWQKYLREWQGETERLVRVAPALAGYVVGSRNSSDASVAGDTVHRHATAGADVMPFLIADEAEHADEGDAAVRDAFAERWRSFCRTQGLPTGEPEAAE